jgi:hypothetical protein
VVTIAAVILFLVVMGAIQLWYGTYRMKRRDRYNADSPEQRDL